MLIAAKILRRTPDAYWMDGYRGGGGGGDGRVFTRASRRQAVFKLQNGPSVIWTQNTK